VLQRAIVGLILPVALPHHAAAQDFPIHSLTIQVPFAPGRGTDMIARAIARKLEQPFGKSSVIRSFVIEHPGM
jgi:tripartite-type tricarboxylate transporter receptor subunit TctC